MKDKNATCISVDRMTGIVRVDGFPVFRLLAMDDGVYVQFQDGNKLRSHYRGDRFIEIPLDVLVQRLEKLSNEVT